jgi:hypothetical protein
MNIMKKIRKTFRGDRDSKVMMRYNRIDLWEGNSWMILNSTFLKSDESENDEEVDEFEKDS